MNCTEARQHLPELIYGDLPAEQIPRLEQHLQACKACQRECRALRNVQRLLGSRSASVVQLDLPRLYREAIERQKLSARRWRRVAIAVTSAAAIFVLCAVGIRLEARVEPHQLTLRWSAPPLPIDLPQPQTPAVSPGNPRPAAQPVYLSEDQLHVCSKLIHALADDLQALERRQQRDETRFLSRLRTLQEQTLERCVALEKDLNALYILHHKGE